MKTCIHLWLLWLWALTILPLFASLPVVTNIAIDFAFTMVTFATTVTNIHWRLWLHEDARSVLL
jgi:hypothetical protein